MANRWQHLSEADRFWSHVQIGSTTDCWPWTAARNELDYGVFRTAGKNEKAHRTAYRLSAGESPPAVLHRCDNPPCCNPAHLKAGTQQDNMADMHAKGRRTYTSRFAPSDLEAIRQATCTRRELAERYGCSESYISMILSGKRGVTIERANIG